MEEYFQLQYPNNGSPNPFGVAFIGGKGSFLRQKPIFKIIDVDKQNMVPYRISTYEFDYEKANRDPTAAPEQLITLKN